MVIATLILLGVSVGLGIWLGMASAPYNTGLFTIHKLASVAFAVLLVIQFVGEVRKTGFAGGDVLFATVCGAALIALIATGAIASIKAQSPMLLRVVHAAAGALLSASAIIRLLR